MSRIENIVCRVNKVLEKAIRDTVFPGCAAAVVVDDQCRIVTLGRHTYESNANRITPESVFDVASLTKAIPVSCSALKLIEQNKLSENDLLIMYVPQFCGTFRELITVHHLLTHTLDSTLRLSMCKDDTPDELMGKIIGLQLRSKPGEQFNYSNATSILLGLVLENCTGKTLDILGEELFFKPLGMNRTGFDPLKFASPGEIVPSEIDPWRGGVVLGEVHDESAWKFRPRVVGSAGLFSSIVDITRFITKMLESFQGNDGLFPKETAKNVVTNQLNSTIGQCTGLGWELNQHSFMGSNLTTSTFGKTGFTGCSIIADPIKMSAGVLLSNHIYPQRRSSREQINSIRSAFADCIFG